MNTENVVELAKALIAIPSISPGDGVVSQSPYGEAGVVALLSDWLTAWGARVEISEAAPGRPNLVARLGDASAGPCLLMEAHSDTVAVDGMTVSPFEAAVRGGRLYGRGACDVKGPMAAMLAGIRRYLDAHDAVPGQLCFAAACGEELGGLGASALVSTLTPRPDAVIVAEPTEFGVVHRHKGVVRYRITTQGRAAHSSRPAQGVNAIGKMQRVLAALHDVDRSRADSQADPQLGHETLSVGMIHGGSQVNIVPERCSIEVDHRLLPGQSPETASLPLRERVAALDADDPDRPTTFETDQAYPPLDLDPSHPLVETVLQALKTAGLDGKPAAAHYGTDAGFFSAAGIPAVVTGPGSIRQAHTADEFIEVATLEQGVTAYAAIIERFFGG